MTVLTAGSRGDVQPYVALACGLRRAGHEVVLATHAPFGEFVRAHGLTFFPTAGDPQAFLAGTAGIGLTRSGENFLAYLARMADFARPLWHALLEDWVQACQGAEAIVISPLAIAGLDIAEALGVPVFLAPLLPLSPTREAPMYLAPVLPGLGAGYNLATHGAVRELVSQLLRFPLDAFRRDRLGLPAHRWAGPLSAAIQARTPSLFGFSEAVIRRPADWPERHVVTGYWFLDRPPGWRPPPALEAFLAAGPPPVYVGFGSMVTPDPAATAAVALAAVAQVGCRAIVATGWGGLRPEGLPPGVLEIEGAPHDWLFPRVAAVVHHGGAGTTAAALRAGVPAVVTPFFSDQPFWARRLHALEVAPPPVAAGTLDADRLGAAIRRALTDARLRARAAAIGRQSAAEDGVGRAAAAIEAHLEGRRGAT